MGLIQDIPFFNCDNTNLKRIISTNDLIYRKAGNKKAVFKKITKTISRKRTEVPIWEKATLTLEEAAEFSGIGIHKIRELSDARNCKFVLWNGNRRLIKRKKFEEFIDESYSI